MQYCSLPPSVMRGVRVWSSRVTCACNLRLWPADTDADVSARCCLQLPFSRPLPGRRPRAGDADGAGRADPYRSRQHHASPAQLWDGRHVRRLPRRRRPLRDAEAGRRDGQDAERGVQRGPGQGRNEGRREGRRGRRAGGQPRQGGSHHQGDAGAATAGAAGGGGGRREAGEGRREEGEEVSGGRKGRRWGRGGGR